METLKYGRSKMSQWTSTNVVSVKLKAPFFIPPKIPKQQSEVIDYNKTFTGRQPNFLLFYLLYFLENRISKFHYF